MADKFSLALSTTLHRNNEDFPDYYDKVGPTRTSVNTASNLLGVSMPLVHIYRTYYLNVHVAYSQDLDRFTDQYRVLAGLSICTA